jgi:peptide deformylase
MKADKKFKSKPAKVKSFNVSLNKKLDSLVRTLKENGNSSLAAPKVGLNKRIILLKVSENEIVELINPEVIKENENKEKTAYQAVAIQYQNREGEKQAALLTDVEAVRFHYEFEFLNGFEESEECKHEYEIVHGLQDSYEQCSKCKLARE